jgi:hypothetical protein
VARRLLPGFNNPVVAVKLAITDALVEMVDRKAVYHWAFEDLNDPGQLPRMPGPLIETVEGDTIELSVTNTLHDKHGFAIPGVPGIAGTGVEIPPGETKVLSFPAPKAGSYMYLDHLNAPVSRVLGLHGPMVVLPAAGNTPYSELTPNVQQLFNDLGTTEQFPGEPWKPERTRIWLFNTIDPAFNEMAQRGEAIDSIQFTEKFLPRYFTINGESGAYATHNHDTIPSGRIGQPHLIRIMNAGMAAHSLHIHANHVYVLSRVDDNGNNMVQENVFLVDTFTVKPLEHLDWLLPFIRPPDIPGDTSIPLRDLIPAELSLTLGGVGQSPLTYPSHDHMEMSQTAAGGNYPQGIVTNWEITGDLDGARFPESNPDERGGINQEYHGGRNDSNNST